jgi:hypothetical protein
MSMITTLTPWRLVEYFGFQIPLTAGASKKKRTQSRPIFLRWLATDSQLYHMVLEQGQFIPWARRYWLETVKNHRRDTSRKVIISQLARDNNNILAGDCAALDTADTENDLELKKQAEDTQLHRMAQVHDFLEM